MLKKSIPILVVIAILALCAFAAYHLAMPHTVNAPEGGQPPLPTQTVAISSATVVAEIASTQTERERGLSGRSGLPEGRGMLFVFPAAGNWGFWMPDMAFSIDIIWADAAGEIVAVAPGASPQSYPKVFYPGANARYALEVPAGFAAAHGIAAGSLMSLPGSR